ncbi:MAG: PASTA domain-containing protein [Gemmatimonadota bacterium]
MKRVDRRAVLIAIGVAVGAFLVGYGVTALAFTGSSGPADVVMVPDVREMTVEQARRAMDQEDLTVVVGDSFPNPQISRGAILAQSPLPGQEVSPNTEVRLIISTGPVRLPVPDVQAMPLDLAVRALQTAGFNVAVDEEAGEGEVGTIVSSDPEPGTRLELPATVHVVVGDGMPEVAMPRLVGMREQGAREIIADMGLELEVVYQDDSFVEPGGVIAQEPAPGDSVEVGSAVELRVAAPANVIRREGRGRSDERRRGPDDDAARESGSTR